MDAMHNTPFRLLESPQAFALLCQQLAQVGLSLEGATESYEAADPYHPACLRFACRWLSEPVELHWHYEWWPDGTKSELGKVTVHKGAPRGEVSVEQLLGQRLDGSLAETVIERIVTLCGDLTGKRNHSSMPRRST
jgi:hypothetical protein